MEERTRLTSGDFRVTADRLPALWGHSICDLTVHGVALVQGMALNHRRCSEKDTSRVP